MHARTHASKHAHEYTYEATYMWMFVAILNRVYVCLYCIHKTEPITSINSSATIWSTYSDVCLGARKTLSILQQNIRSSQLLSVTRNHSSVNRRSGDIKQLDQLIFSLALAFTANTVVSFANPESIYSWPRSAAEFQKYRLISSMFRLNTPNFRMHRARVWLSDIIACSQKCNSQHFVLLFARHSKRVSNLWATTVYKILCIRFHFPFE